jgi:hypothetical protein
MVRGPLPRIAVLGPTRIAQPELVKLQVGHIAHTVEDASEVDGAIMPKGSTES